MQPSVLDINHILSLPLQNVLPIFPLITTIERNASTMASQGAILAQPPAAALPRDAIALPAETAAMNNTNNEPTSSSTNTAANTNTANTAKKPEVIFRAQVWLDTAHNMNKVLDCLDNPSIQFVDMYLHESFLSEVSLEGLCELMEKVGRLAINLVGV